MKRILKRSIVRFTLASIVMLVLASSLTSCSKKVSFLSSSVVPAARGVVKVSNDQNKNYVIEIDIVDLADVSRLNPSKESYVAWMETDQGDLVKLGQLDSKSSFMSKQLKASLSAISSFKPSKVFVTAEDNSNVQYPDRLTILTTDKF